jgi:adenylylsulfate kinase
MIDFKKRSFLKALTWRVSATLCTMSIVYIFTSKIILTLEVGGLEVITKMIFYYFHERIWEKIKWGRII